MQIVIRSWNCRGAAVALLVLGIFAANAVTPAAAASCTRWTASVQEDEGGPAMTATVCANDAGGAPALVLQCGAPLDLRYDLGDKAGDLEPGITAKFTFTAGTASLTRQLDLEAMDNMFTTELAPGDALLAMLQSGHEVSIADAAGKYGASRFSLDGSRAAIAKVKASCHAPAADAADDD